MTLPEVIVMGRHFLKPLHLQVTCLAAVVDAGRQGAMLSHPAVYWIVMV